jgi:bacteriocin-like protein
MQSNIFTEISSSELSNITGGVNAADVEAIKQQAAQYCPVTAAKYANIDPGKVTRAQATQMGNSCVAEISPMFRGIARGRIDGAINKAFPEN